MFESCRRGLPSPCLIVLLSLLAVPTALRAQSLTDFCPEGDESREAALVGIVTDAESGTVLPGAQVAIRWTDAEGESHETLAQTGLDGVYVVCALPRETDMQVAAAFGDRRGAPVSFSTAVVLQQQDLAIPLTAPEPEEVELDESLRSSGVFNATVIRDSDLEGFPDMTVYQLLRQHQRLRFERLTGSGVGEVIIFAGRGVTGQTSLSGMGRFRGVEVYINERREADPVNAMRVMSIREIKQLDILSASEASARYGGDGWIGVISIRTRDR